MQVVAWAKMLHDYSQVMSGAQAVKITFDGSAPCALCKISQHAREAAREQMPRDDALGGEAGKVLLLSECVPAVIVTAPDFRWPGVADAASAMRTEAVPVPPPVFRAHPLHLSLSRQSLIREIQIPCFLSILGTLAAPLRRSPAPSAAARSAPIGLRKAIPRRPASKRAGATNTSSSPICGAAPIT